MKMKQLKLTLAVILGLVICPKIVSAHAIETNFQLQSNALKIQSSFSNGEVYPDAKVVIYSPNDADHPWFEGRTDQNGEFKFNPDPTIAGNWSIEIGEDNHWDRLIVPVDNKGVEFELISQLKPSRPHEHYDVASQFLIGAISLGTGIGFSFVSRKFK
jgi:nickel transport protein